MTLQDRVTALSATFATFRQDASPLHDACAEIADEYQLPESNRPMEIEEFARLCRNRINTQDWSGATEAEIAPLLRAAAAGVLSADHGLDAFVAREVELTQRQSLLSAYFEGYLEGWSANAHHTVRASAVLSRCQKGVSKLVDQMVARLPEILDPADGAEKIGQKLLGTQKPYENMQSLGFTQPHAPGLAAAAGDAFLAAHTPPREDDAAKRLMAWCRPDNGHGIGDDGLVRTLNLLLKPWYAETPDSTLQDLLLNWILEHIGDPRLPGHQGLWLRAEGTSRTVVLSWLAGRSIDAFMDIISAVEDHGMWRRRRDFWLSLFREGVIDEAWVALHPAGRLEAERRYRETVDPTFASFGRQEGKRRDTPLLIMRCRDKIVVEGSQNYRVHVFPKDSPGRPELYQDTYLDQNITLPLGDKNARVHDRPGNWMGWVRRRLE